MIIKIDVSGEIPIYVQLRNEIVKGIGRGEFADARRSQPYGSWRLNWG